MPGKLSGNNRSYGYGGLARFLNPPKTEPSVRADAALRPDHPALREGRTVYISRVFDAGERDRILIAGINNAKIGNDIRKGPWRGMPIFTVALEERATCPRTCAVWAECYGNGQPVAVRFRYNDGFLMSLEEELSMMGDRYPQGFAVRLHTLGDFPEIQYVGLWRLCMGLNQALHVWGYTAHQPDTDIGAAVIGMNDEFPGRWVFRTSVRPETPSAPWQATTTWDKPTKINGNQYRGAGGVVCPAEIGASKCCATCGLCWSASARDTRITFLGHGGRGVSK